MLVGHLHIIKLNVFVFKHTLVYFMFFFLLRVTGVGTCWGSVVVDAGAATAGSDDLVLEEFHHFTVRRNVPVQTDPWSSPAVGWHRGVTVIAPTAKEVHIQLLVKRSAESHAVIIF